MLKLRKRLLLNRVNYTYDSNQYGYDYGPITSHITVINNHILHFRCPNVYFHLCSLLGFLIIIDNLY